MSWRWVDYAPCSFVHARTQSRRTRRWDRSADAGLLESALARPKTWRLMATRTSPTWLQTMVWALQKTILYRREQANGFLAVGLFLYSNGYRLRASRQSRPAMMAARGFRREIAEAEFGGIRDHAEKALR